MAIGGMKLPKMNPNDYMKMYAAQNGMNVNDAKTALQGQYGNPQMGGLSSQSIFSFDGADKTQQNPIKNEMSMAQMGQANGMMPTIFQNLMNFFSGGNKENNEQWGELEFNVGKTNKNEGINAQQQSKGMDPETYAQQYAEQNGISVEEARAQLKAKYGEPQKH